MRKKSSALATDWTNVADMTDMTHVKKAGVTARVQVIQEAIEGSEDDWRLCFQWCRYIYGGGAMQEGYRFIWRRPDGSQQAARGQARIPSIKMAQKLMKQAEDAGWGKNDGTTDFHV